MKKIPVGQTIAEAYRFTFASLDRVIGVIWLPIIILTIGDYFVAGPYLTGMANAMESGDAAQLLPLIAGQITYGFVQLVLIVIIGVAITREILAPLQRPLFLRFSLGATELRVVAGIVGLYAMFFLVGFICMVLGMVLSGSVSLPAMAAGQRAIGVAALIALLLSPFLIYTFVRLAYFIVPSVVLQGKFGLEHSWQLAKGNVGRIILIALAVGIPLLIVAVLLQAVVMGPEAFNSQVDLFGDKAAQARQSAEHLRLMAAHLPLLKGLEFVLAPFMYGLAFAAPAFAYKTLAAPQTKQ